MDRCSFKWYLNYAEGWKPRQTYDYMELGVLVHGVLEAFYKAVQTKVLSPINNPDLSVEFIKDHFQTKVIGTDVDYKLISQAMNMTTRYVRDYVPFNDMDLEPVVIEEAIEAEFVTPTGKPYIIVFIPDLIWRHTKSGKLWLVDHKTYKSTKWTTTQINMDPQFALYILGLRQKGIDIYGVYLNGLNTYPYKHFDTEPVDKLFTREPAYKTPVELENFAKQVGWQAEKAMKLTEYAQQGIAPPRSLRRDCDKCWFQEPCLMGLKGMDINVYLEATFYRKGSFINKPESELELSEID